jgi:hypothetical protein
VEIQSNSEFQSLTSSPTRSPGPPQLQIDVQHTYEIGFGHSTYVQKENETKITMALVPSQTKIGFVHNGRNNFNIQSQTHPGVVHTKTDAHVTYDI